VSIYFHDRDAIYVSLYTPSEVRWNVNGVPVKLIQTTNYPESDQIAFRVEMPKAAAFAVNMRIPAWLAAPAKISVNGKAHGAAAANGTFASIHRTWKNNDTVELRLPFGTRTEAIDDRNPDIAALMQGPRMMVAVDAPAALASAPLDWRSPNPQLKFMPYYAVRRELTTTYFKLRKA
jgi:hypothetical protein